MADDKLRKAALKPIASIKKTVVAAEKKEETKTAETKKETAKKTVAKKATTKKAAATTKTAEAKTEEPKKEEPKKEEPKKAATKKTAEKKETATAKKATAKKAPAEKKEETKATIVLQYADKDVTYDTLVENAKNVYQYDMGGKVEDIKTLDLYVKPEESKVYFVVNGEINGECML